MKKSVYTQRKILSLLLTLVMILSALPLAGISAFAEDETHISGDFEYKILDDGTAKITSYIGDEKAVNIPSMLDGYTISVLDDFLFLNNYSITSVTIPNSVTYAGWGTFENCQSLTEIAVADDSEFYSSQDGVLFNKDVTKLLAYPAGNARAEYTIPSTVTYIDHEALWGCSNLKSITLPEGLEIIEIYGFAYCNGLTSITIPDSVIDIHLGAFYNCVRLRDIYILNKECNIIDDNHWTIPSYITIHGYAGSTAKAYAEKYGNEFVEMENPEAKFFTYRILKDGTAEIMGYTGTAEVLDIPSVIDGYTVTSLGKGALNHNDTLTSVTIPDSVTNIGGWAFNDCDNLSYVTIPDSVVSIGDSAFRYCSLSSIDIPNSVKTIGSYVFYDCDNLTSVTIPESVESIDICAFSGCDSLTSIEVDENNEYFSSLDGVLFNKDKTKIIQYPAGIEQEAYTMPDSVEIVGKYSFSECDKLKDITISENALDIDYNAFAYCTGLTSVIIPEKVEDIYYGAFNYCDNLSDIYIYSRECMIFHINHTIPLETTIHGYPDSYAEEYAKGYGNEFIPFIPTINVTATVDGEEYDGEYTAKEIVITAETYAEVYLSVDGGEWTKLEGNSINAADGVHTYDFKAVDHYVESEIASVTTKREADTPILSVEVTGTTGEWTKDNVSFKLSAENIASGVTYYYSVNGTDWTEIDGDTLTVSENTNAQYVFKCVNGVGNESEISVEYAVMIDKTVVDDPEPDDPTPDDPTPDDPEPKELKGDVNNDGKISVIDAKWILQYIAGTREFDERQLRVGDLNSDNKITVVDAKWILQIVAGTRDAETLELIK